MIYLNPKRSHKPFVERLENLEERLLTIANGQYSLKLSIIHLLTCQNDAKEFQHFEWTKPFA
jgi:hypothetical protein